MVGVTGAAGTLYAGEQFTLLFKFGSRYPFIAPQVECLLLSLCAVFYVYCLENIFSVKCTRNSAVADKPRDAFVQARWRD